VQFRQRPVRHEMAPAASAPPPARLIDEHGHSAQPRAHGDGAGDLARRLVAPRPPPSDTDER
jgi:hypothetical protein